MQRIIEIRDELPLMDKSQDYPYGTMYLIGERTVGRRTRPKTIGEVTVTDAIGRFDCSIYGHGEEPSREFELTTEEDLCDGTVAAEEVALCVATMVLRPSAATEAAVLVALGEDGFANI